MRAALAATVALAACGDPVEGVPVGQAEAPGVLAGDPFEPRAPGDTSDVFALPPLGDTLATDSLAAADTLTADTLALRPELAAAPPAEPEIGTAWAAFLDGDDLAASPEVRGVAARALAPPFGPAVRALSPRAFRRDGTRREAVARVGFDAGGGVVPQEEAVRDSTLRLVFDVVNGAYRLVGATLSE